MDLETEIMPFWKDCYVSDETYATTLITLFPEFMQNHSNYITREIDWSRGKPYVWQIHNYDLLIKSNALFARKFDPNNLEIADALYETLTARKEKQNQFK